MESPWKRMRASLAKSGSAGVAPSSAAVPLAAAMPPTTTMKEAARRTQVRSMEGCLFRGDPHGRDTARAGAVARGRRYGDAWRRLMGTAERQTTPAVRLADRPGGLGIAAHTASQPAPSTWPAD